MDENFWFALQYGLSTITVLLLIVAVLLALQASPLSLVFVVLFFLVGPLAMTAANKRKDLALEKGRNHYLGLNPEIQKALATTEPKIVALEKATAAMDKVRQFGSSEESRQFARDKIDLARQNIERLSQTRAALINEIELQIVLGDEQVVESELATNSRNEALANTAKALKESEQLRRELQAR